ncbi:MAG: hypothetical protein U0736_26270 [Gemmataceae bacterium]
MAVNLALANKPINLSRRSAAGAPAIETIVGTAAADVLSGNRLDNRLAGGGGDDVYRFYADLPQGVDAVVDPAGTDTLDFSPCVRSVTVALTPATRCRASTVI